MSAEGYSPGVRSVTEIEVPVSSAYPDLF
jgi:hypothetical protein